MGVSQAQCNRSDRAVPYVLGELDARAHLAFERHLKVCPACRAEVELLTDLAAALPLLSAQPNGPDPEAEEHIHRHAPALAAIAHANAAAAAKLAAAMSTRADVDGRPSLQAIPGGGGEGSPVEGDASVTPGLGEQAPADALSRRPAPNPLDLRRAAHAQRVQAVALRNGWVRRGSGLGRFSAAGQLRGRWRLMQRPVPGPAVLGFIAVALVGVVTVALSHRAASIRYERVSAGWTQGGAAIKLDGSSLELLVEDMPLAPRQDGYEVWVMERRARTLVPTTAWLRLDRKGDAGVTVPGDYHDWYALAVYVEPLHGRKNTRSGAVVVADLRNVP